MVRILQISDLHFGPFHWDGDDKELIKKINSYDVDLIINTGDSTSDGLEREYIQASKFLKNIKCQNLISIIGNHDKRSRSSVEFFKKYILHPDVIYPENNCQTEKKRLFLDSKMKVSEKFTDVNFIKEITIQNVKILIISLDSNLLYNDDGFVEVSILNSISKMINKNTNRLKLLLIHHSILGTDMCPLRNSQSVIDFVDYNKINYVFCGHTHEIDFRWSKNIYNNHQFFQFMCGATASNDVGSYGKNIFVLYEINGKIDFKISLVKIFEKKDQISFEEEIVQ